MRDVYWGGALSLVALGGLLFCLNGCSGRKAANADAAFKRDTLTEVKLEDAQSEAVADNGNSPVGPVAPTPPAPVAGPKDPRFVIRMSSTELKPGQKITGSVAGKFSADLYRLVWVDAARRVVGAYELHSVANEKETNAVIFDISYPVGCIGEKQKLVLISAAKDAVKKAEKEKTEPAFNIEAEIEFTVSQKTESSYQVLIDELNVKPVHPLAPASRFQDTCAMFAKTRDEKLLVGMPSIFDDASLAKIKAGVDANLNRNGAVQANAIGSSWTFRPPSLPFDYDMSPQTLEIFRGWLEERYGSLQSLNLQWGTKFEQWNDVVPPTTDAIKAANNPYYAQRLGELKKGGQQTWEERGSIQGFQIEPSELHAPGQENFSAWCDFREFTSFAYARLFKEYRSFVRNASPSVHAGIGDIAPPSPWTCDPVHLSRSVDFTFAHESSLSRDLLRSFAPNAPRLTADVFNSLSWRYRLWLGWMNGDSGVKVVTDAAAEGSVAESLDLLRGLTALRQNAPAARDPIAIYYSPRSLYIHWLLDSELDGSFWLNRNAEYEAAHSSALLQLTAWQMLLEDLGYAPYFISPEQAIAGQLQKGKAKVVILPKVLSLGRAEAEAIRSFARGGGIVIADGMCGTFDEHGRRREPQTSTLGKGMTRRDVPKPIGILDADFGIVRKDLAALELNGDFTGDESARLKLCDPISGEAIGPESDDLRVLEPGVQVGAPWNSASSAAGSAALISKGGGMGRFLYLNLSLQNYVQRRSEAAAENFVFHGMAPGEYEKTFGTPRGGEALRIVVGDILGEVLSANPLRILNMDGTPLRGIKRTRLVLSNDASLYAVLPLGSVEKRGADFQISGLPITAETQAWAALKTDKHWYDSENGKYLGHGSAMNISLHPDRATLLAALPYKVERLALKVRRTDPRGSYKISGNLVADTGSFTRHVAQLEVLNPDGKVIPAYTRTIVLQNGGFSLEFALGLNEAPGRYKLQVRDIVTGTTTVSELLKDTSEYSRLFP